MATHKSWGTGNPGNGVDNRPASSPPVIPEKCCDLMTKNPVVCQASDTAAAAAKIMERKDLGVLPVTGNLLDRKLVGIVTDRDLALRVIALERNPETTTVGEIMSTPVVTCLPDDKVARALDLMRREQLKRIPVADHQGHVVGIISQADVVLRIRDVATVTEVVRSISRAL